MEFTIYKGQFGYSVACYNKDGEKTYLTVSFVNSLPQPKEEKTRIKVLNGFFSCYESKKQNLLKPKLIVQDYEEIIQNS